LQNGVPVFKQITYRLPIDRPGGKKGGGYVFFDTELGVGTTFRIYLPRSQLARDATLPGKLAAASASGGETVLVVEDEATVRQVTVRILKKAETAREAATVRAAQVRPPAVPLDYLLAHREYSPTAPIEGIGPGLRTASATSPAIRP
jgi:hypothetical protein